MFEECIKRRAVSAFDCVREAPKIGGRKTLDVGHLGGGGYLTKGCGVKPGSNMLLFGNTCLKNLV